MSGAPTATPTAMGIGSMTMSVVYFRTIAPAYAIFIRVAASTVTPEDVSSALENKQMDNAVGAWKGFPWSARWGIGGTLVTVPFVEICVDIA